MEKQLALDLIDFLYKSPTAYHSVKTIKEELDSNGFKEIKESEKWNLQNEGKYYVIKNDSALIAFTIGNGDVEEDGFRLIGAHTDSPGFRVKANPEMVSEGKYLKLNTEGYGGPILYTWFDRPLGLAGKVTLKGKSPLNPEVKLVNINKPLLIIPSVAIHMNRAVNDGFAVNKQKDTLPLLSLINEKFEKDGYLVNILAEELKVDASEILGFDLGLHEVEKGCLAGLNEELISCGRLDDMWMVYAGLKALIDSKVNKSTKVMVCIDNEEIGSLTPQGANSALLLNILERITLALGKDREGLHRALSNSIMISADLAHAVHPNAEEKHDPTNRPVLGNGPVLKTAASGSYSTDSYNAAIFEGICKSAGVPYQKFFNRSDVRGGTTIGPITSSLLTIPVMDMGAPLLSMHSIRELAAVKDNYYTIKLFTEFFNI
ncbi:M18 family aminopeptidase [Clostridium tertium]|jgi:aspartyl aminopeptidase|uniref:M18 family aminopeptidase n=1 Tax=Clostridium TaxID=1485 RepID=UPI000C075B9A|nr:MULTISPECIES: M18 family aminopeptidase [Clostridium]MBP1868867.1 aspartyl aminopeptidase [Clostridium tertium]MDB1920946.1 M18 family aminopeptidase [Clostridium tertium]MDB1925477.1 M18 family aminopeptidase [Clostridium tertium]MDB1928559.1 M18 family aminopeptidase [Clostridium tertium]MDB1934533.1 M18 family aminopeptidase [Clostridium tertium]